MSEKNENNIFDEHYYKILKNLTWLIGLWPYQPLLSRIPYYPAVFSIVLGLIIAQIWEIYHSGLDMNNMVEIFPILFASFIIMTKICGFTINHWKVKILLEKIKDNWKIFNSQQEIEIVKQYAEFGRKLAFFYTVYMCTSCFLYLMPPFTILVAQYLVSENSSWPEPILPAHVYYGKDTGEIFLFAFIHSSVSCLLFGLTFSALDSFFIILIQHVCSIFVVLGMRLEKIALSETLDYDLYPKRDKDSNYMTILRCIVIHKNILQFSNIMESIFSVSLFFEIGLHIIMISVAGVQVLMHTTAFLDAVQYISMIIAQTLHLLWICWQAQSLLNTSAQVNKSICRGNWYKMSKRSKQLLQLMLMRSSIPCRLTAGKIFTVSMQGFATILKTTISYFTVLESFQ